MKRMNTNDETENTSIDAELETLEHEKIIRESSVSTARDRYASEFGCANEIERMRWIASIQPKTYRIPKRIKRERNGSAFIEKIKKLLGL